MTIAICFFGITRSLKYTIKSIKENILQAFEENNIDYDIYLHTYKITSDYVNYRAKETTAANDIDNEEYKLLNPKYLKIDIQEIIKKKLELPKYRTKGDPWQNTCSKNYNSLDNFILGSYSKFQVTKMVKNSNKIYDHVLFIRPDCLYVKKFNIDFLKFVNNGVICTPDFSLHSRYLLNDRMAICNMNNYWIYGNIFETLLYLSKKIHLHSETILGIILEKYNIKSKKIDYKFIRVRCNGELHKSDLRCIDPSLVK